MVNRGYGSLSRIYGEQKKSKLHEKITCPELYLQERLLFSTRSWKHRRCEFSVRNNKKKAENWTSLPSITDGRLSSRRICW